jgi:dolichol kinase
MLILPPNTPKTYYLGVAPLITSASFFIEARIHWRDGYFFTAYAAWQIFNPVLDKTWVRPQKKGKATHLYVSIYWKQCLKYWGQNLEVYAHCWVVHFPIISFKSIVSFILQFPFRCATLGAVSISTISNKSSMLSSRSMRERPQRTPLMLSSS